MSNDTQQTEATNVAVIIDPKQFGLEESKAAEITQGLTSIIIEKENLRVLYSEVMAKEKTKETCKEAYDVRRKIADNRTKGILVWHKANKEYFLRGGQFIDATKNKEVVDNEKMENDLLEFEKHFENLEKQRLADLKEVRLIALRKVCTDPSIYSNIEYMEQAAFDSIVEGLELAQKARIEAQQKQELLASRHFQLIGLGAEYDKETETFIVVAKSNPDHSVIIKGDSLLSDTNWFNDRVREIEETILDNEAFDAEAKRLDNQATARRIELAPYVQFISDSPDLRNMPDADYSALLDSVRKAKADFDKEQEEIRLKNEELEKELKAKEEQRIASEKAEKEKSEKEKAEKDSRFEKRKSILIKLGFTFDENSEYNFRLKDIWSCFWEQVYNPSDKEFEAYVLDIEKAIGLSNENAKLEVEAKQREDAEKLRIANEKAEADKLEADKKKEAEKAAKAPKKTKLTLWVDSFQFVAPAGLENDPIVLAILEKGNAYKSWAKTQIEAL